MPHVTIARYHDGKTTEIRVDMPTRVTRTGNEDHFRRATEDADMVIAGMRANDLLTGAVEASTPFAEMPRYRIKSLVVD